MPTVNIPSYGGITHMVVGTPPHIIAILKLEEHAPEVHKLAGDILADTGDLRGAVTRYNGALEQDYNTIHYHVKKAEARKDGQVRRGCPGMPPGPRYTAAEQEAEGDTGRVAAAWRNPPRWKCATVILAGVMPQAMQPAPDDHTRHDQGGNLLRTALELTDRGDLRGAILWLNVARHDGFVNADVFWLGKARVCARAGYLERALRCVEKSRDGDINDDNTFAFRADILYRIERHDYSVFSMCS